MEEEVEEEEERARTRRKSVGQVKARECNYPLAAEGRETN